MITIKRDPFGALPFTEILAADPRPTFVFDLKPDQESPLELSSNRPVFFNAALTKLERLLHALLDERTDGLGRVDGSPAFDKFKSWATDVTLDDGLGEVRPLRYMYDHILWTGFTIRERWRVISGSPPWHPSIPSEDGFSIPARGLGLPIESRSGVWVEQGRKRRKQDKPDEEHIKEETTGPPQTRFVTTDGRSTAANALLPSDLHSIYTRAPPKIFLLQPASGSLNDELGTPTPPSVPLAVVDGVVPDWTVAHPKGTLSAHVQVARSVDWSQTPLGPMEMWSPEFRQVANLCMSNPHPAALFWGSELTMLYNDAYSKNVAGPKHPALMGSSFSGKFREIWEYTRPIFAECARTGVSVCRENDYFAFDRSDLLEEVFFSWSFTPLYGGSSQILGFYNAPFETTQHVLWQRRMQLINKVGEHTSQAKAVKQFWKCILDGLQENHFDVPFAIVYSVVDSEDEGHSPSPSNNSTVNKCCYLEGSIAVPAGHRSVAQQLNLQHSGEGFAPAFRDTLRTREPTVLHAGDENLPTALLEGIDYRGFGARCRDVIIFPVRPTNAETVMGFLVLGVNTRRIYDDEYKAFTRLLNRQLSTSLASIILYEDEVRRSRDVAETAALERERLTQQLDLQANRLRRMTELSPLGLFLISPEGVLREANDRFFEMTSLARDGQYEMSWIAFVAESSLGAVKEGWNALTRGSHLPWEAEVQVNRDHQTSVDLHGECIDCWVMFNAHCEFSAGGTLRSVMGSITDISHLKWAQGMQERQLREAEETRRRQNEFIDITSHEMRNPLSAILQCADDVASSLGSYQNGDAAPPQRVIQACLEATQIIELCVQHQKTIVDDILTISKLDSKLLELIPTAAQPTAIMKQVVTMFNSQLQARDIEVVFETSQSYDELGVDWVMVDSNRVLQILINLMTNAIKFTAGTDNRVVTVAVAASLTPPDLKHIPGFEFIDTGASSTGLTESEQWGSGEVVYVRFKVRDTGCGLNKEDKRILFQRFKQATPRTHIQYGGSGLGLFISKRLAELHGGLIGVASEAGRGSLFVFFVQVRRTLPPAPENVQLAAQTTRVDVGRSEHSISTSGAMNHAADTASSSGLSTAAQGAGNLSFDPRDFHVLVVEDNQVNQKVLVAQLKKLGFPVSAANDGLEALEFLAHSQFQIPSGHALSIILMDLEMPNMDGLVCVRRIRTMEAEGAIKKHVPVIAVTANVRDEHVTAVRESGMDGMVSKPFRIPELLAKMRTLLGVGQAAASTSFMHEAP